MGEGWAPGPQRPAVIPAPAPLVTRQATVGAIRLVLSTELSNTSAQRLYEKLGWRRNTDFCNYQLAL
jgi:hypothetical protein